ncbi:MAG: hypothetical protein GWP91_05920 [Rhodobacterales bacterium]|nr:hypothetical protein [Rhodobacterales bacterium]
MKWSDNELEELAGFFAKRMTPGLEPIDPTDPPPSASTQTEWLAALKLARDGGMLPTLARQIGQVHPGDENLQHACALLTESKGASPAALMGAALSVGTLLAFVGGGLYLQSQPAAEAPTLQPQSVVMASADLQAPAAQVVEATVVEATVVEDESVFEDEQILEMDEVIEDVVAIQEAPTLPAPTFKRCMASEGEGELVGYWYAGEEPPGTQGSTVTLGHAVNVRVDYPDVHNRFDARSTVTCVLQEGDVVRLTAAAVKVPGNAYWIPLISGDLAS